MKNLMRLLVVALLGIWLVGCATSGGAYDDGKVAKINKDTTTEMELLDWFGPATTRTMGPDGSKILTWRFAPAKGGTSRDRGSLEVRLDTGGKVAAYKASSGDR